MDSEQQRFMEISEATERYFQQAQVAYESSRSKDEFYSKIAQLAKYDIARYGEDLIPMALIITKQAITHADRSQPNFHNAPNSIHKIAADGMFVMQVLQTIQLITALALAFGERGIWKLFEMLNTKDEDIATLAASCFGGGAIQHPQIIPQFKNALNKAEGTTFKLNLAHQLVFYGDRSYMDSLEREHAIEFGKVGQLVIVGIADDGNPYNSVKFWRRNRH